MCGINGLFHVDPTHNVAPSVIHAMRESITHRGPDDHGILVSGNVGLGFNRLSIIDLAGGHQPLPNEDETVWIVFNGEIYNFASLRDDLLQRGHRVPRAPIPRPSCTRGKSSARIASRDCAACSPSRSGI